MDLLPIRQDSNIPKTLSSTTEYPSPSSEELVNITIESYISHLTRRPRVGGDESFFVADLGRVVRQYQRWTQNLPQVRPYFAVKCNSDRTLLKLLADLGTGFDCASVEEIRNLLSIGVDPARILFANPCKAAASLAFARQMGVVRTTFDNLDELDTIKKYMPEAQLLLRIYANDDSAIICLGEKFGAHLDMTQPLLSRALELGLDVIGVSFHVGTGAKNPMSFCRAIQHARIALSHAERLGFKPGILDIGGGFQDCTFKATASLIREALEMGFPPGMTFIAEPGRFFARGAFTLVCRVIARRRQLGSAALAGIPDMLYQSDGVYGNFMNVIMEKENMVPKLVVSNKAKPMSTSKIIDNGERMTHSGRTFRYSIWGPTCDSVDCVAREATFENEVKIGDWLKYDNMGAYTSTTATQFNGFRSSHDVLYVNSEISTDD